MTMGDAEAGQESGKEFREKFEATQAENAALRNLAAEQFGVSPEELKGVPVDQFAAKATEIVEQKKAQRQQILRESLEEQGLSGDDLESALKQLTGTGKPGNEPSQTPQARSPFASTGALSGTPIGKEVDPSLKGQSRIRAALREQK